MKRGRIPSEAHLRLVDEIHDLREYLDELEGRSRYPFGDGRPHLPFHRARAGLWVLRRLAKAGACSPRILADEVYRVMEDADFVPTTRPSVLCEGCFKLYASGAHFYAIGTTDECGSVSPHEVRP